MKLLFRHIKNSILRSPYQILVLLLTIFFSATIFACVTEVYLAVREEKMLGRTLEKGNAEIVIKSNGLSDFSYLTVSDLGLGEEEYPLVSGYLSFPLQMEGKTFFGVIANFEEIGNVFDFAFTEYQVCDEVQMNNALFITEDFARQNKLRLGDEVELNLLGANKTYIVRGINRYTFFGREHILIQAEGAIGALSSVSPTFAVFDGKNPPCNYIYLRLTQGQDLQTCIEELDTRAQAFGWTAKECKIKTTGYDWLVLDFVTVLLLFLSITIAGVLVGFSLRTLGEKRRDEMYVFWMSGMPQYKIFFAFCVEIGLYFILGLFGGIIFSNFFLYALNEIGMRYAFIQLTWRGIIVAILAGFFIGAFSLWLYKKNFQAKKTNEKKVVRYFGLVTVGLVCSMIFGLFFPIKTKVYFTVGAFIFSMLSLLISATPYCKGVSRRISVRFEQTEKRKRSPHLVLAGKNFANVRELHTIYRIVTILLTLVVVLIVAFSYSNEKIEEANTYFQCDYVVANGKEVMLSEIEKLEGVEGACSAFIRTAFMEDGKELPVIDADISYIGGKGAMPQENGICMSKALADLYGYQLGDEIILKISEKETSFTLTDYNGENSFYAYINAESCGFRKNMILIKTNDSADVVVLLTEKVASYGGILMNSQALLEDIAWVAESINGLFGRYLSVLFILSTIGCINLILVGYMRRREQFGYLIIVGMTKKEIGKMIAMEASLMLISVFIITAISSSLLCISLDFGMQSLGLRLFG